MTCSRFSARGSALPLLLLLLVMVVSRVPSAESVTCSPYELMACSGAMLWSTPPSGDCCSRLREQQPCLCEYIRDPSLGLYVNSPNARRVGAVCRVPFPQC